MNKLWIKGLSNAKTNTQGKCRADNSTPTPIPTISSWPAQC